MRDRRRCRACAAITAAASAGLAVGLLVGPGSAVYAVAAAVVGGLAYRAAA